MTSTLVIFIVLSLLTLYAAYRVATAHLITHAALFLAGTFAGVAALFFMLQADFLAAVQLLLYAGAVMAVVVFAIMLSQMREAGDHVPRWVDALRSPFFGFLPLISSVALFVILLISYLDTPWPSSATAAAVNSTRYVAVPLFQSYALPFEVASVLLLAALIGAIVLTRREDDR